MTAVRGDVSRKRAFSELGEGDDGDRKNGMSETAQVSLPKPVNAYEVRPQHGMTVGDERAKLMEGKQAEETRGVQNLLLRDWIPNHRNEGPPSCLCGPQKSGVGMLWAHLGD